MKFKHNKKRNTAFLYEALIKELTHSVIKKEAAKQDIIKNILKEFFSKGKLLKRELDIYTSLMEMGNVDQHSCQRMMHEVRKDFMSLDRKSIFNEQTRLIKIINESLSNNIFATFLNNYRDIATIGQFFNSNNMPAKQRILIEDKTYSILMNKKAAEDTIKHIDNLTLKTFVNKFNEAYQHSLTDEQKKLLTNYITSFANNGVELKAFINEEVHRMKEQINKNIEQDIYVDQFNKILQKVNGFSKKPINEETIKDIFYIQDLLHEVAKNDS